MGPFNNWSSGGGFEYFYGFLGGEPNQYYPAIYEGTTSLEPPKTPEEGYHFTEDMTNKAIKWVRQQKSLMPDKPFFMYFAPGAMHAPHHVPKAWADKYKGRFDQGWDALREQTFARQKYLEVIPADCEFTKRHAEIPAWDAVSPQMQPLLARQIEVYAGFLEHTDHHVGRLSAALQDLEILDDTLIYYIFGDNGASAEGTLQVCFNEMAPLNGIVDLETPEFLTERLDKLDGPEAYNHYAVGWAHAMNTPYQWTKQVASHFGGTRNSTIVHWPKGIQAKGEIRSQFTHVIDLAPTVPEAAGLPEPRFVHGIQQKRLEGVSMAYAFDEAKAAERHETQYFEMVGNRGIYHKGWTAVTKHRTPWITGQVKLPAFDDDVWEPKGSSWRKAASPVAGACTPRAGSSSTAITPSGSVTPMSRARHPFPPARTRCGWSLLTTAEAWRRAVPSRSISTGRTSAMAAWSGQSPLPSRRQQQIVIVLPVTLKISTEVKQGEVSANRLHGFGRSMALVPFW
jgi:arylsulfatase